MTSDTAAQANAAGQPAAPPLRRPELDLIGMGIVLALIFLHTCTIFSGQQLIINLRYQGTAATLLASAIVSFAVLWAMPLMMVIAGMTARYSLQRRTVGQFVRERVQRLLVPFLTGLVLTIPIQVYLATRINCPTYRETFWQFLPRFWHVRFSLAAFPILVEPVPQVLDPSIAPFPLFTLLHLWFLLYLLVATLLLLPLLLYLRRPAGQRVVAGLAAFFSRPWAIYLLALPIALIESLLLSEWPSSWNRLVWPFLILVGFIFAGDERFEQVLVRHRLSALILGINGFALYFGLLGIITATSATLNPFVDTTLAGYASRLVKGLAAWFWVVAILGWAIHRRQRAAHQPAAGRPGRWEGLLAYAREAQLPFYVLHHLPIIVLAYFVVPWQVHPLVKFLAICPASYAATFLLYDLGVRRTSVTRFLFGLRARR